MPITTVGIGAAVTPTVIKTYLSHYTDRKPRRQKPTAHISYDEGLHVIRTFLEYASHHTVEDLQAFTAQWVPTPSWVRTEAVSIPAEYITRSADTIITQLGEDGVQQVGGQKWWQWRRKDAELKAEWIEMRADYNARKQLQQKSKRIMLYVHGGAYFFGSVDEHRYQMQRHARKLKARVFAPRYRLAPQFPFPCGLQDCLASYLYLLSVNDKTEIILAGDSAGGGMVLSMMCILRDQGLPLPAGAILISPWVDLTHSFPSVAGDNKFDYIPAHGFMQKPSVSWPPPNDEDMEVIARGAGADLVKGRNRLEKPSVAKERAQGVVVHDENEADGKLAPPAPGIIADPRASGASVRSTVPGPSRHLSIEIGGKTVELRDQIQMYATNQLISHPLVSPVLQPSLGGLPPLLILTGGGEVLRDEQIYLAHKAAAPTKYPLGDEYRKRYDPDSTLLDKYKPTSVYLQVWDDLCHVAPTLSFTRPAKYMYRSVAQFGAWALSRAQDTTIELDEDDDMSVISGSDSESETTHKASQRQKANVGEETKLGAIGKAGDPIPAFKQHMIRQRIDRHGNIYNLGPASELAALQLAADEVGVIKVGPVKKWMDAKQFWDTKYAKSKRRVQKRRIEDLARKRKQGGLEDGESPPPSALAGRQHEEKEMVGGKLKKSFYLAMWSGWGSKHDEDTIKREQDLAREEEKESANASAVVEGDSGEKEKTVKQKRSPSRSRKASDSKKAKDKKSRSRSARRTNNAAEQPQKNGLLADSNQGKAAEVDPTIAAATATAAGVGAGAGAGILASQHEHRDDDIVEQHQSTEQSTDGTAYQGTILSKFKNQQHLRAESNEISDAASVRTGISAFTVPDNASTRAVFAASGISREKSNTESINEKPSTGEGASDRGSTIRESERKRRASAVDGYETPSSRRSVERLMSHQIDVTNPEGDTVSVLSADMNMPGGSDSKTYHDATTTGAEGGDNFARLQMLRSPSSMAVVQAEGVVGVVEGGNADKTPRASHEQVDKVIANGTDDHDTTPQRPAMYDRGQTEFQTAMEKL